MVIVLMGAAGAGKTTVGHVLAKQLGWEFVDADSLHPQDNLEKMKAGIPLNEKDRQPWLKTVQDLVGERAAAKKDLVLAFSGLRQSYRDSIGQTGNVRFVYLKGSRELLYERLRTREGHVAGPALLPSQLAILEEPMDAIVVDAAGRPDVLAKEIRAQLFA